MKRVKEIYQKIIEVTEEIGANHVGAYAAQSAYFFMLCMIPIILLLLTLVQYTPVTKADVMTAVMQVFPTSVDSMMATIVNQVYNQSRGIIPITIIVALWSAGKGVLAMTTGLNCVYHCRETRNYLILRLRSTLYTVMFLLVILFLLLLSVFGNSLNIFIASICECLVTSPIFICSLPTIFEEFADRMIELRAVLTPIVLVAFLLLIYKFLPNRKDKFIRQLPGAVFTAIGWMAISWIFSVYVDVFTGFSSMYGSLTTSVLIMLWMYFCMYCILLGGELNMRIFPE